jgi:NADPH:quinone reductase-like Zn-dependent oxidoreductase
VQLADGTRWYVTAPPVPYGTLAELVPVPDSDAFPVPAGRDPALAAALGVAVDLVDEQAVDAGLAAAARLAGGQH